MANIKSAQKRIRRNERARLVNKTRLSRIRTFMKKVDLAIESGDQAQAQEALKQMQPELARGQSKGLFHKNNAARKMSRFVARIKAMGDDKKKAA